MKHLILIFPLLFVINAISAQLADASDDYVMERVKYLKSEFSLDEATTTLLTKKLYRIKPEHSEADWHKTRKAYEQVLYEVLDLNSLRRLANNFEIEVHCFAPEEVEIKLAGHEESEAAHQMFLSPNPAKDYTRINYDVGHDSHISIVLMDDLGQHIRTLVDRYHKEGSYEHMMETFGIQSNLYLVVLRDGKVAISKKLVVQK